jgi:hypothetical protein
MPSITSVGVAGAAREGSRGDDVPQNDSDLIIVKH